MSNQTKIEKISNQEIPALIEITKSILIKNNYQFLENINDHSILMQYNAPLRVEKNVFIFSENQLSGVSDSRETISLIKEVLVNRDEKNIWIVSKYYISKSHKSLIQDNFKDFTIDFLDRDALITMIDRDREDYWKHDDYGLLDYEKEYCETIVKENDLKGLKIFTEKYARLLDIFIDPKIIHFYEDKETKVPTRKNISIDNILSESQPIILSGEAGTGKSTFLRKLGEILIKKNELLDKKHLPIFITVTELYEKNYELNDVIMYKLRHYFNSPIDELSEHYNVLLLIDSIDELEPEHQNKVASDLDLFFRDFNFRYIVGTRSSEKLTTVDKLEKINSYNILRFSSQQIQQFVSKFFPNEKSRADQLLEALKENRIIEKLPITPLSLSLISILYEENDLEIPATITDIYENFNSLLLGKAVVSSRVEFIDISFKERILSIYALKVLQSKEKAPLTKVEFFQFFEEYYESKTIPVKRGTISEVLNFIIEHTGVLYIKNNTYVSFYHDSFMEYYASLEVFKHQRELTQEYVDNFFDLNWQNSAVFFAGQSKDMSNFLKNVNVKISKANNIGDYFSAISGVGYLLQALYQTDNAIRKDSINIALNLNIEILNIFIKLSADDTNLFKDFKLPIIWIINLMYFFENFNSGTLREPLKLSYLEHLEKYLEKNETAIGYQSLILALTLNSTRINEKKYLEDLIFKSPLLNDNILLMISEISLKNLNGNNVDEIKKEVRKEFKKVSEPMKYLLSTPANRLRFSDYDVLKNNKKIKLLTEGKSDAAIIEHAFMTLTNGKTPYWQINACGLTGGGASEVYKTLLSLNSTIQDDQIFIGIFDHDDKGIGEYGRLNGQFEEIHKLQVKKHKTKEIYAVLLPIPGEMASFLIKDQAFNVFSIEHYFGKEYLESIDGIETNESLKALNVFKIKKSKKNDIEKDILKRVDSDFFKYFTNLFDVIDKIAKTDIDYAI